MAVIANNEEGAFAVDADARAVQALLQVAALDRRIAKISYRELADGTLQATLYDAHDRQLPDPRRPRPPSRLPGVR